MNFMCCFSKQNSSLSSECLCRLVVDFQKNSLTFTETSFCVFLCIEMTSRHLSSVVGGGSGSGFLDLLFGVHQLDEQSAPGALCP